MSFLKKIKYAISKGMEGSSLMNNLKKGLEAGGPAFGFGSNVCLNLTFEDMDEVKAHPLAGQALVTFDEILKGLFDMDSKTILELTNDFSKLDSDQFKS